MRQSLLAIECSSQMGSVALLTEGQVVGELDLAEGLRHGTALMPAAKQLLQAAGLDVRDLAAIGVGVGPGSYTGTRIGVMAAKALAFGADLPLAGISSLAALAYTARELAPVIVPIMDARREEVFAARYRFDEKASFLTALQADVACRPEQVQALIPAEPCVLVGSSIARDEAFFRGLCSPTTSISSVHTAPTAGGVGALAWQRLLANDTDDPIQLQPVYLRREDSPAPFA